MVQLNLDQPLTKEQLRSQDLTKFDKLLALSSQGKKSKRLYCVIDLENDRTKYTVAFGNGKSIETEHSLQAAIDTFNSAEIIMAGIENERRTV